MNKLYPIKFIADPRERVWGGDYLTKILGKEYDEEFAHKAIGESWELWSIYGGSSVVKDGFLAGNTLDELMEIYLGDLVGENVFNFYRGEFPLLIKILDVKDKISVQVHPSNEIALEREESFGKAEMWYIMDAKPGSKLYIGFNKDVTPTELYNKCKDGTVTELLNCITPQKGDCVYIYPGCVHAVEGEVVIAEIQQSSDLSYRLYDWGRENNPSTARTMHLEDAIDVVDYSKLDKDKYYFQQVTENGVIVDTSNFVVKMLNLKDSARIIPSLNSSFLVYVCVEGCAQLKLNNGTTYDITRGETIFIPASMEDFLIAPKEGNPKLLEVYMPQIADDPDSYLNYDEPEDEAHGSYKETTCDEWEDEDDHECDDDCHCGHHHHHNNHPGESFFRK